MGLFFFGWSIQAQNFYVKTGAHYSLQMPSIAGIQQVSQASATSISYQSVDYQITTGLSPQATLGYLLNQNISFEISMGYHFGNKQVVTNQLYNSGVVYNQSIEMSMNYAYFNPNFVVNAGFEKLNPYIGLGSSIGIGNVLTEEITNDNSSYLRHYSSSGGVQFGFYGKVGLDYVLCSNWSLYAEIAYANCSWAPEKKHLNKATDSSGDDVYETIKPYEMLTEYKENYKHNSAGMIDYSKSQKRLKSSFPLDFISMGIGVKFRL